MKLLILRRELSPEGKFHNLILRACGIKSTSSQRSSTRSGKSYITQLEHEIDKEKKAREKMERELTDLKKISQDLSKGLLEKKQKR